MPDQRCVFMIVKNALFCRIIRHRPFISGIIDLRCCGVLLLRFGDFCHRQQATLCQQRERVGCRLSMVASSPLVWINQFFFIHHRRDDDCPLRVDGILKDNIHRLQNICKDL